MSIVVAVTKNQRTVMAADSLTSFGDGQRIPASNSRTAKIRRIDGTLLGSAGWGVYDAIFGHFLSRRTAPPDFASDAGIFGFFLDLWKALHERYPYVNDQSQSRDSPFGDLDSQFLIANGGGIHLVSHDLDVCRFERYFAIGSGSDYALGAMHALYEREEDAATVARLAVETAMEFDMHCGGPIALEEAAGPDAG